MPGQKEVVTLADGRVVIPKAEAKRLADEASGLLRLAIILVVIVIVLFLAGTQLQLDIAILLGYILGAIAIAIMVSVANLWYQSILFESGRFELKKDQPKETQDEPKAQTERIKQDAGAFVPDTSPPEAAEA